MQGIAAPYIAGSMCCICCTVYVVQYMLYSICCTVYVVQYMYTQLCNPVIVDLCLSVLQETNSW